MRFRYRLGWKRPAPWIKLMSAARSGQPFASGGQNRQQTQ